MPKVFLSFFIVFFFVANPCFSKDEQWLGRIIVTGTEINLNNIASDQISQQDIRNSGATSVAETLSKDRYFVTPQSGNRGDSLVKLHGFDQRQIMVMLDGVPISVPFDGYINLDNLPIEDISQVDITPGLSSVLYGSNAMGGVINIETKKPTEPFKFNSWMEFGEYQAYSGGSTISVRNDKFYARLSAQGNHRNKFRLSEDFKASPNQGPGTRDNSDYENGSISFLLGFEPGEDCEYAFRYSLIDKNFGIPVSTIDNKPRYWRFTKWEKETFSILGRTKIGEIFNLRSNIFYDKYFNVLDAYDDDTYSTQLIKAGPGWARAWHSAYDDYSYGANLILETELNEQARLDFSFNTKYDHHSQQNDAGESWEVYSVRTNSLAAEYNYQINDRLSILLGLIYEFFDPQEANGAEEKPGIDVVNPQLGLTYDLGLGAIVYAKAGRRSRFPTLKELYSDHLGDYRPNPSLDAEKTIHYEIGWDKEFLGENEFSLSLFRSNVDDLIESVNDPLGIYRYQFQNIDKVIFQGVNTSAKIYFFEGRLILRPYYNYLYHKDISNDRVSRDLSYRPGYKVGANIQFEVMKGLFFYLNPSYISWQRYEDPNSTNNWQTLGGYAKIDCKIEKRFNDLASIWFRVDNLLDRSYQAEFGYPQPGREFFLGFRICL